MADYITKFNVGDTAYLVDAATLAIVSLGVLDTYVHEATIMPTKISYRCRYISKFAGKNLFNESELLYKEEAKALLAQLLSEKESEISNLG